MAADDSMDDEVFETQEDTNKRLTVFENKDNKQKDKTPSPTGYRNYRPPSEVLRLGETESVIECVEQPIHKVKYR